MVLGYHIAFVVVFGLAVKTAFAAPVKRSDNDLEHNLSKRNFVPNRFDIIDNEIKHAIQKEVQNALRKNFVPSNPLLEGSKWGKPSPARYPVNQPTKIYGMEYDEINPSRSDPGYLVLDLKQLSQGRLKFHEQQVGGKRKALKAKGQPRPPPQNVQSSYQNQGNQQQNYGQYSQYQPYGNTFQPNTQPYQQQNYQNYQQQPNNNAYPIQSYAQNPAAASQG